MYTFEVIEKNENEKENIIEMSGVKTKFTVQQILDHVTYTEKVLRESKAQLEINEKQNEMTLEIIPALKDLPEDKWQLVMSYAGRKVSKPEIESLIETSEKTLKDYEERLSQIKEATGISTEEENG